MSINIKVVAVTVTPERLVVHHESRADDSSKPARGSLVLAKGSHATIDSEAQALFASVSEAVLGHASEIQEAMTPAALSSAIADLARIRSQIATETTRLEALRAQKEPDPVLTHEENNTRVLTGKK